MADLVVNVTRRETRGSNAARRLRKQGMVPAVLYGESRDPVAISVEGKVLGKILHSEKGDNTLFELALEGTDQRRVAMVKQYQLDPLTDELVHADFIRIDAQKKVHVNVFVELEGVPEGVKTEGGRLDFPVREVMLACLPGDIPSKLVADVSAMHVNQTLHVGDLVLPEGVVLETDPAVVLAVVHAKAAAEEEAPVEGEEAAETPEGAEGEEEPKPES